MELQLAASELDMLYEVIKEKLDKQLPLESLDVATGAVPQIIMAQHQPRRFTEVTITDRVSGIFTTHSKKRKEAQLSRILMGDALVGVQVCRRLDATCHGCAKLPGCDRFETGSIMFSDTMCTGYTNQERGFSCRNALGMPFGNCDFLFHRHHPSKLKEAGNIFYATDVIPNSVGGISAMVAFIGDLLHGRTPQSPKDPRKAFWTERLIVDPKLEKIDFALYAGRLIVDAYSSI